MVSVGELTLGLSAGVLDTPVGICQCPVTAEGTSQS